MSGICGIVAEDRRAGPEAGDLLRMTRALGGPGDGEGLVAVAGRAGLAAAPGRPGWQAGTARLGAGGEGVVLAFHGSLYNWDAIRDAVRSEARPGTAPLEALLRLLAREGAGALPRLRGEFALALWDEGEESLVLATDPFRVVPLFYGHEAGRLVFASRLAGLGACPRPPRLTIDPAAIVDVVSGSAVPTPRTVFREARKLPAHHALTFRGGLVAVAPYWTIPFRAPRREPERTLAEETRRRFRDAVAVRLAADGDADRIGAFLSGGVDSSTVTGVLTGLAGRPVKTFSVGFAEEPFNELAYARIAARAFRSEHHERVVSPADARDAIPVLLREFDEPFGNASAIPTYLCARAARDHGVRVLYAGDGGDELFAGNERYATQRLFDYYLRVPGWIREPALRPAVRALAGAVPWTPFVKGRKYIERASIPYPERLTSYGVFSVVPMARLLDPAFLAALGDGYDPSEAVRRHYAGAPAETELDRQLYIDLMLAISDNDLLKVTRMTAAAGVAVRFPFLDRAFAEFAATVPAAMKMRGRRLRSFFKRAYAGLLPAETRAKRKHGFGLPIAVWLRTDPRLNEMMRDLVLGARSVQRGYFRRETLEELVRLHATDRTAFYGTLLWNLMVLELWLRRS